MAPQVGIYCGVRICKEIKGVNLFDMKTSSMRCPSMGWHIVDAYLPYFRGSDCKKVHSLLEVC
jgi:hypothetical protein